MDLRSRRINCSIYVAKTKALISCAVTAQLICAFVFSYAESRFSHDVPQIQGQHHTLFAHKLLAIKSIKYIIKGTKWYKLPSDMIINPEALHQTANQNPLIRMISMICLNEPCHRKTSLRGFRPGPTHTRLYS